MNSDVHSTVVTKPFQKICNVLMASCLGVMAVAVFINVVMRYGFGSGIAASEELSRLLFVWMVFIGATAAYPAGEHMAFTSLVALLRNKPVWTKLATLVIRLLVILGSSLVAWGAWQQVVVGLGGSGCATTRVRRTTVPSTATSARPPSWRAAVEAGFRRVS